MSNKAKSSKLNAQSSDELKQQILQLTEALQRERADAGNLRRRHDEERAQLGNFYKALVIRELLPALDNLNRALTHIPKDIKDHDYARGVQGVAKQFEECFKKLGVERIKTVGQEFDPRLHEAVSVEDPATGSGQTGSQTEVVCEELSSGYKLGDEIIRHAMVKVKMEYK